MPYVLNSSTNPVTNRLIENLINGDLFSNTDIFIERFDDKAFEENLCREAFSYLEMYMNYGRQLTPVQKACIVAAFTFIALKYYDGDLHSYIEKEFRKYCASRASHYKGSDIQIATRHILDVYKRKVRYFNPNSYIAVPLVLCCVPHSRISDLFTIAYDIYKKKLLFDEDVTEEQINEKVIESLNALRKKDLVSNSDKIKGTTYLMSNFTQSCIYSGCGVELLARIISRCIRLILDYLSRPSDSFNVEPYYTEGYEKWVRAFESDSAEKESYERRRILSQPCFRLVGKIVHLVTGKFSMDESYNPTDVKICVYREGSLLQEELLCGNNDVEYVDENDPLSGYIINRKEIHIAESPLDSLSYTIMCGGIEIYNSKTRLHRKNLFFDGYGNEVKPGNDYNGLLRVITHGSNKSEYEDCIQEDRCGAYYIATIEVNNQDIFRFDDEPYVFFKVSDPKLISHKIPWALFKTKEKAYSLYNDIIILFSASCDKDQVYIEVDNCTIYRNIDSPATDVRFNIKLFSKNHEENCAYTIKLFNLSPGFHNVKIFNSVSKKQICGADFNVVCDPGLKKTYIAHDDNAILYDLTGGIIDTQQLIFEYGTSCKDIRAFVRNLGYGNLVISPSSISYSIDNEKWYDINKFAYLCDIPESAKYVNICAPEKMSAFYIDKEGAVRKSELTLTKDGECATRYRLYLDYLRTLNEKKKIVISFEFGSCKKIIRVWKNPYIDVDKCDFFYNEDNKTHVFKFVYEGECELEARITSIPSGKVIKQSPIHNGSVVELPDSAIESDVVGLKVSLHGVKYGALLNPFDDEPFMVFPKFKYKLKRECVELLKKKIVYDTHKKRLICRFTFEGTESSKIIVNPSGFKIPVFEDVIKNGQELEFDCSKFVFSSYNIALYAQKNLDAGVFNDKEFFVSQPIKTGFSILHKPYKITHFILDDKTVRKVNWNIFFEKIEIVGNTYYFVCNIEKDGRVTDEIMAQIEDFTINKSAVLRLTINIMRRVKGKITNLKLTDGHNVIMVLAEK